MVTLFIFRVKRDRGLFHRGGLKLPSFFFPFFHFLCVNGFYLGRKLSFFCSCFFFFLLLVGPVVNYDPHRA
jgi:hypothetical protein